MMPLFERRGAEMKHLRAVIVCLVALYAVDAYFFDGWYFGVATQAMRQVYALNW